MPATVTNGFLYVATGEKWVREAVASATKLREMNPDIPVACFTDLPELATSFDDVRPVPDRPWVKTEARIWALRHSPFDRTVHLDTDTYPCGDLTGLFTVLDRFDFAAVPVQLRLSKRVDHADPTDIPDAFQTVNGGLLAWRSNDNTRALFETWWNLYQADKNRSGDDAVMDQPSLRVALWRSDCHILLLPPEYNVRTNRYRRVPTTAIGSVRMIHGRPRDYAALERHWNASVEPRLLTPVGRHRVRRLRRRLRETASSVRKAIRGR